MTKKPILSRRLFASALSFLLPGTAYAACSNPDGKSGRTIWSGSEMMICNGEDWQRVATRETVLNTGEMKLYAGTTAPDGWLFTDGTEVSRTAYAALFALIGTKYGAGDGAGTFNLPYKADRITSPAGGTQMMVVNRPDLVPVLDGSGNPTFDADGNPQTTIQYVPVQIPYARERWIIKY